MILSRRESKPESNAFAKTDSINILDCRLTVTSAGWSHINYMYMYVRKKSPCAIGCIRCSSGYLPVTISSVCFFSLYLHYCSVVWYFCKSSIFQKVEQIQNYSMHIGKPLLTHSSPLRQLTSLDYSPSTTTRQHVVSSPQVYL